MRFKGLLSAVAIAACLWALGETPLAHEHKHTHQNLTRAAFRLLELPFETLGGLTKQQIEDELAQGVIDEDECLGVDEFDRDWALYPNWNSHFYEAKLRVRLSGPIAGDGPGKVCDDGPEIAGTHTSAADRARALYRTALNDYAAGKYRSAFRVLGRVLHLLEDMTSPAHVHDDPHGFPGEPCGGDIDDFERYGYCEGQAANEKYRRICEYFHDPSTTGHPDKTPVAFDAGCVLPPVEECRADFDGDGTQESYGVPPRGFTCRLWSALHILYDGKPQVSWPDSVGDNVGYAFVHKLANVTYDFTTFTVHLQDISGDDDPLPSASELSKMLRGSTTATCAGGRDEDVGICEDTDANGWHINGSRQAIGHTDAQGFRTEGPVDTNEEWWLMPFGYNYQATGVFPFRDIRIDGYAYIENSGGEGPDEDGTVDNFVPLRYGCTAADTVLCSENFVGPRSKIMFQTLYGTVDNLLDPFPDVAEVGRGKTLLRIYGDVLYTSAVAYGAGLVKRFIDEVTVPPDAVAGGPYTGEACTPVLFNAGGSSDSNGEIAKYEWDLTSDGTLDVTATTAASSFTYQSPFSGQARLRVTDNDGFFDEATADVTITPDVTGPVIATVSATPALVGPPNHKMNPVTVSVSVADACSSPTCQIVGVTSNQPDVKAPKPGQPDWVITGPLTLQVRGESAPRQNRIYTVTLSCADASGNATTSTTTVTVSRPPEDKPAPPAPPLKAAPTVKKGRYKKAGNACVWDANDNGANQCTPVTGRYKIAGGRCVWDAKDRGANQCTPNKGRYKKAGGGCVWTPNDSGPNQCTPARPR